MQGVFIGGDLILTLLICLIIPGFLGYLVFKYSVQEDLDRRSESTQIAMMLLLGISGIASLCAINFLLRPFPDVASFISPDELMLKKLDVKFWTSYLALFCTSMLSGAFWAFISERGIAPTLLLSRGICYCLKHSGKIPLICQRNLIYIRENVLSIMKQVLLLNFLTLIKSTRIDFTISLQRNTKSYVRN